MNSVWEAAENLASIVGIGANWVVRKIDRLQHGKFVEVGDLVDVGHLVVVQVEGDEAKKSAQRFE